MAAVPRAHTPKGAAGKFKYYVMAFATDLTTKWLVRDLSHCGSRLVGTPAEAAVA